MIDNKLAKQFAAYSDWRKGLVQSIAAYRDWLSGHELNGPQIDQRLQHVLNRLHDDQLNVAFVAEFSRGKSELINAIFFANYGTRLLPSSAGRTTMCPTELLYDKTKPPCIRMLPIETRLTNIATSEYKHDPAAWNTVHFDVDSNESMVRAFKAISNTKAVSVQDAERLGLFDPNSPDAALHVNADGTVDVPCWRYAMINFPHPLLEQGLVILDTPGLNAIGIEPELTINMLPNAHAILFILAADQGVTKSEIDVWRQYIDGTRWQQKGRLVVMNKIDGLWDDLKDAQEIEYELDRQLKNSAKLLGLEMHQIFPVSAQKALLAKVNQDDQLLARSRLLALEKALTDQLLTRKQEIVRDNTAGEIEDLMAGTHGVLEDRLSGIQQQLSELRGLVGKNQEVIAHMMHKVKQDKENFEKGLQRFRALRNIFSQYTNRLFTLLGMDALKAHVYNTRQTMIKANFTKTMREAMDQFFSELKKRMTDSDAQIEQIKIMMDVMYEKFSKEHGLRKSHPPPFSTLRYQKELAKLERAYHEQFNTAFNMIANEKMTLTTKFFETLASRVVYVYEVANREVENWLKAVISPMELQVSEHQQLLQRRLESIKRIHQKTDGLEERIRELAALEGGMLAQLRELNQIQDRIQTNLNTLPVVASLT